MICFLSHLLEFVLYTSFKTSKLYRTRTVCQKYKKKQRFLKVHNTFKITVLEQASDDGRKFVFSACKTLNFHENLLELRRSGTGGGRIVMLKFFQAGNGPFVIVARVLLSSSRSCGRRWLHLENGWSLKPKQVQNLQLVHRFQISVFFEVNYSQSSEKNKIYQITTHRLGIIRLYFEIESFKNIGSLGNFIKLSSPNLLL